MSEVEVVETTEEIARRKERAVRHRAEQIASLANMDAFQALRRHLASEQEKIEADLLAMLKGKAPLDQRNVDRAAGFIEGMHYIDVVVGVAVKKVESYDSMATPEPEPDDDGRWDY